MVNVPPPENIDDTPDPSVDPIIKNEQYLAYIQAGMTVLGIVFFGLCIWFGKLDPTVCVVAIVGLLNGWARKPIDLALANQARVQTARVIAAYDRKVG